MSKVYYMAVIERASDGFGVFFPDLPGCVSGGDTVQVAAAEAEVALALHVAGMLEDGDTLPKPRDPVDIPIDPDVDEAARVMIGVRPEHVKVRVNIMMDQSLLAAIDAHSPNRSRFLSDAARVRLASEG